MERQEFFTQLVPLVKEEAANIKLHARKGEIEKLDKNRVNGHAYDECVYGLMTGSCNSPRALELIALCCEKVYVMNDDRTNMDKLNGHSSEIELNPNVSRHSQYLSPIEHIIFDNMGGKKLAGEIIDYIKGEIAELSLEL